MTPKGPKPWVFVPKHQRVRTSRFVFSCPLLWDDENENHFFFWNNKSISLLILANWKLWQNLFLYVQFSLIWWWAVHLLIWRGQLQIFWFPSYFRVTLYFLLLNYLKMQVRSSFSSDDNCALPHTSTTPPTHTPFFASIRYRPIFQNVRIFTDSTHMGVVKFSFTWLNTRCKLYCEILDYNDL